MGQMEYNHLLLGYMIMNRLPNCRIYLEVQAKLILEAVMKLVVDQPEQQGPPVQLIQLRKLMNQQTTQIVPRTIME